MELERLLTIKAFYLNTVNRAHLKRLARAPHWVVSHRHKLFTLNIVSGKFTHRR